MRSDWPLQLKRDLRVWASITELEVFVEEQKSRGHSVREKYATVRFGLYSQQQYSEIGS